MNIYCDTHVHCYDMKQFSSLLDHAHTNFSLVESANRTIANEHTKSQFLMFFTEGLHDRTWSRIYPSAAADQLIGDWRLTLASDDQLIHASKDEKAITLAPARQINSAHRLEFLLLGCAEDIDPEINEQQIIDSYSDQYFLICPWGFGKWMGKRSSVLKQLLSTNASRLFLGDNGGRPRFWHNVLHFRRSRLPIINGSDPLPLASEARRVGSYGVHWISTELDLNLKGILQEMKTASFENFGVQQTSFRFIRNQIALRFRKHV